MLSAQDLGACKFSPRLTRRSAHALPLGTGRYLKLTHYPWRGALEA
jgi:hypothetical protein